MPEYFTRDPVFDTPDRQTGGMASAMTLRDHFAAAVVAELIRLRFDTGGDLSQDAIAAEAYELADAMVAESLK